jgi:hypothetical protein
MRTLTALQSLGHTGLMSAPYPARSDETVCTNLPLLYNLVYCSRATAEVNDAAVERIIQSAQRWNPMYGITGMLVFGGGIFFQWLEGPHESVTELMAILERDSRHESVVVLTENEELRERMFPDWSMERVTPQDIKEVLLDALGHATDPRNAASLNLLLEQLDSAPLSQLRKA